MVIVSHDREFLDQVCTKIVDAEGGMCTEYNGNYSRFLQLKKGKSVGSFLTYSVS
jgi:ATPase subunit of ABC transporter with duplicated ATPase domains